jgi:hypothetical protein
MQPDREAFWAMSTAAKILEAVKQLPGKVERGEFLNQLRETDLEDDCCSYDASVSGL